jgi:integrase
MPKRIKEFDARDLKSVGRGVHFVGGVGGLTLQVKQPSHPDLPPPASWVLRAYVGSKRRNFGLGPYPEVSLAEARQKATDYKRLCLQGIDPLQRRYEQRRQADAQRIANATFRQVAEQYLSTHEVNYRNEKHAKQWRASLTNYAYPVIGNIPVRHVTVEDVLRVLQPLWTSRTETAKRLQGRLERVFDLAVTTGLQEKNPARWKNFLSLRLPAPGRITEVNHYPSLLYQALPRFMRALSLRNGMAARALEFLILTAVRSGSVRQARWSEIDFEKAEWRIPKSHTKTRQSDHRVPLTPEMISLLRSLPRRFDTHLVFPSPTGKVLSDMALNQLMRKMRQSGELPVDAVPHGFRSTFRVWAAEATNYPAELAELCLMHSVGNAVYAAYQRSDLFEKRRQIMADWNHHAYQVTTNVVALSA